MVGSAAVIAPLYTYDDFFEAFQKWSKNSEITEALVLVGMIVLLCILLRNLFALFEDSPKIKTLTNTDVPKATTHTIKPEGKLEDMYPHYKCGSKENIDVYEIFPDFIKSRSNTEVEIFPRNYENSVSCLALPQDHAQTQASISQVGKEAHVAPTTNSGLNFWLDDIETVSSTESSLRLSS